MIDINSIKIIYRRLRVKFKEDGLVRVVREGIRFYVYQRILIKCIRYIVPKHIISLPETPSFYGDRFATVHHVGFLHDENFTTAFKNSVSEVPKHLAEHAYHNIAWRGHICTWAATQALALKEGAFIECGVWYGILSKKICEYTRFENTDREFFLTDSWGKTEGSHPNSNYHPDIYETVKRRFSQYPNVHLIRGLVPDTLSKITTKKIAYLAIDMNGVEPERAALEYFYHKIVPGGIIYFDDYGWGGFPELGATINQFFENKPENLLHFPSGNSIVIKH